jgi:maltose O-acetyltransferase
MSVMREGSSPGSDPPGEAPSIDMASRLSWARRLGSLGAKIVRGARRELDMDPAKVACGLTSLLPQLSFVSTRTALLRAAGIQIGARSGVLGPVNVTGEGSMRGLISIGDDSFITGPLHIDLGGSVRIGNRVRFGHDVSLLTVDHEIGPPGNRCGAHLTGPIVVEDGAWVASRVTILPGVTVGRGAIVAAGAVVTRDVLPNTLVAGVPAKLVRALDEDAHEPKRRLATLPRD